MNSRMRKIEVKVVRLHLVFLGIMILFSLGSGSMAPSVFADTTGDIAALRSEVDIMKRQYVVISDFNEQLQKRVAVLEDRLKVEPPQPPAPPTPAPAKQASVVPGGVETPGQVERIAKSTEVSMMENYSKQVAMDAQSILHKIPDYIPNYFTKGLEFHGYFRSGYGVNSKGGFMEAFQAPDTQAKFRLGNEKETYIESILVNNNWNPDPEGITIKTQLRMAYQTNQGNISWDPVTDRVYPAEMYGEMGRFMVNQPDVKVWAGERFYRLPELDIIDFWWYDLSGYGGGFEDIDLMNGLAKLDIAYIGYSPNDVSLSTSRGRIAKNNLNFMFHDIKVPGGIGRFWINGGYMKGGTFLGDTDIKYPDMGGVDIGAMHYIPGELNNNQLAVQFGCGSNTSLSAGANIPSSGDDRNSWRVRITEMFNRQLSDKLCMQVDNVIQYTDYGSVTKNSETWISFGARPIYNLTKHFGIEVEPGMDYVNRPSDNLNDTLFKFTTAFRVSPGPIFNSRPDFRIFATYAVWGNDFKGRVGGDAFADQTNGWNYGVQCENWW